jgi:hypothetical protein
MCLPHPPSARTTTSAVFRKYYKTAGIAPPDRLHYFLYSESQILMRTAGIEPATSAWEALILPLNYARNDSKHLCYNFIQLNGFITPIIYCNHEPLFFFSADSCNGSLSSIKTIGSSPCFAILNLRLSSASIPS